MTHRFAFSVLVLGFVGCGQASRPSNTGDATAGAEQSELQRLSGDGFHVMLPADWTGRKSETGGIGFSGPDPPPRSSMAAILMPFKTSMTGMEALLVQHEEMTERETVLEESETTVAGQPALRHSTTRDYEGQGERKGVRYLIAVGSRCLVIHVQGRPQDFEALLSDFERIV